MTAKLEKSKTLKDNELFNWFLFTCTIIAFGAMLFAFHMLDKEGKKALKKKKSSDR